MIYVIEKFGKSLVFYVIDKTSLELGIFEPSETFLEYGKNKVEKVEIDLKSENLVNNKETQLTSKTINQIKNVAQEEKTKPEAQTEIKAEKKININIFEDLIEICSKKKEIKLKYELEKNVNLVKFEKNRIEISFNESLDKDFVKDLSSKLFEWTGERWIITLSKLKGQVSVKDKQKNVKKN